MVARRLRGSLAEPRGSIIMEYWIFEEKIDIHYDLKSGYFQATRMG